jgi:microcompartment protein CcmL/EutN
MALGMIEVYGFATSVVVADAAAKAADVRITAIDRNKPANADKCEVPLCMTVKSEGEVAAVEEAMEAGIAEAKNRNLYITSHLISRLGEGTEKMAAINALGRDPLRNT